MKPVTVKQFIARLQKLDQTKRIWINYDLCKAIVPKVKKATNEFEYIGDIEKGDYVMMV